MNIILWLTAGGLIGWVANVVMRTDMQRAVLFNIWVGVVGAVLGGWLLSLLAGARILSESAFSISSLLAALLGAVIFLAIMNLVRSRLANASESQ